ncbi:hypothetical protein BDN72DRAFT_901600 [Pluteus cervinus]|uniref:Uncharacterized protein n=1 Tax=Pluteus cervinus TaxID=181527 RepID=A0ACD3AF68_9AGAR|nr:hypothetical protein BDN72DRAFT_901600 [Pluteus cervinus]
MEDPSQAAPLDILEPVPSRGNGEPRLLPKIQHDIFHLAYHNVDNSRDRTTLLQVSKRTSQWLIPLIYRVVVVSHYYNTYPPLESMQKYGHHTHHLYMSLFMELPYHGSDLISLCPNVYNLSFWHSSTTTGRGIFNLPLRRLSVQNFNLFETDLLDLHDTLPVQSWCSNITHMALGTLHQSSCHLLTFFPRLIGFMIGSLSLKPVVAEVLRLCPRLQVLIWLLGDYRSYTDVFITNGDTGSEDDRVVVVNGYLVKDWIRGAQGETDIWAIAEREVEARRTSN